jgi:hypothetical protein
MSEMTGDDLIIFVLAPVAGFILGFVLSRPEVLSGRRALAFSLLPYAGLFLGWLFC